MKAALSRLMALGAVAALMLVIPAGAAAKSRPKQCLGGQSAVDQYCETLPGAGGPQGNLGGNAGTPTPVSGGPGSGGSGGGPSSPSGAGSSVGPKSFLAGSLPSRAVRKLSGTPARRALLGLPSPYRRTPVDGPVAAGAGTTSIVTTLVIVLGAIALTLAAVAAAARRRRGMAT